jgi:hypothetical protein
MATEIDGFAVLAAVAREPALFSAAEKEVNLAAGKILTTQIKDKQLTLADFSAIGKAVGETSLRHALDGLKDTDLKAMRKRFDPNLAPDPTYVADVVRGHLKDLAFEIVKPMPKAKVERARARPAPKNTPPKPSAEVEKAPAPRRRRNALGSKAMATTDGDK